MATLAKSNWFSYQISVGLVLFFAFHIGGSRGDDEVYHFGGVATWGDPVDPKCGCKTSDTLR